MRVLVQRVSEANVKVEEKLISSIKQGLLVFVGIENDDNEEDINWISRKLVSMRLFGDKEGKMNLSIEDIDGEFLVVSQFTLHASTRKGNRPSFIKAAKPNNAIPIYESLLKKLRQELNSQKVKAGEFGADMKIGLINDGPVTIWIDTKNRE